MKQFSLDEYLINPSKKIITRNGESVRIVCTDVREENYPIIALIDYGDGECILSYTKEGKRNTSRNESQNDLFFATQKHERWVNVYKRADGEYHLGLLCGSKSGAEALRACNEGYTATIKIEWEE